MSRGLGECHRMKKMHVLLWLWSALAFSSHVMAQMPTTPSGEPRAPDQWLLSNGREWHHKTDVSPTPLELKARAPTTSEALLIKRAQDILQSSSTKFMALMDGSDLVWSAAKTPLPENRRLFSMSMGKTVTSLAVGAAICDQKITLKTLVTEFVPELNGSDLGKSTVKDLLTMSSGVWGGYPDSRIYKAEEENALNAGSLSMLDVLKREKVAAYPKTVFGDSAKAGAKFEYKSTDPLLLGVILNRSTQMNFAQWVEQTVLLPAGIKRPAIIAQDRFGFGHSDAGIRMFAEDWIRFAVWVNQKQKSEGCLGDYIREASKTQIQVKTTPTAHLGYGYFIWTEDKLAPKSYWAAGYAGQRLAWNPNNNRMLVVFSNDARAMDQVSALYRDWSAVDVAK